MAKFFRGFRLKKYSFSSSAENVSENDADGRKVESFSARKSDGRCQRPPVAKQDGGAHDDDSPQLILLPDYSDPADFRDPLPGSAPEVEDYVTPCNASEAAEAEDDRPEADYDAPWLEWSLIGRGDGGGGGDAMTGRQRHLYETAFDSRVAAPVVDDDKPPAAAALVAAPPLGGGRRHLVERSAHSTPTFSCRSSDVIDSRASSAKSTPTRRFAELRLDQPAPPNRASVESVASTSSSSSSSGNNNNNSSSNSAAAAPVAPKKPAQLGGARCNLTLNLNSPPKQRKRLNLQLNFGCSNLIAIGESVDAAVPLERQGWFHGAISRIDAENVLRERREGSYLVRHSESSKLDYSLSLKSTRGFMHMKIVDSGDGRFVLGQFSKPFASIPEMVHHYSLNKLPIRGAEHMTLLHPVMEQLL